MDDIARLPATDRLDLFSASARRRGLTPEIIEKDFWVCWTLKRAFTKPVAWGLRAEATMVLMLKELAIQLPMLPLFFEMRKILDILLGRFRFRFRERAWLFAGRALPLHSSFRSVTAKLTPA